MHVYLVDIWKELKGLVTLHGKGFFSNQYFQIFGKNPNYPNVLTDNLLL